MTDRGRSETGSPRRRTTGRDEADALIESLVALQADHPDADLVRDLLVTSYKFLDAGASRGDLKLASTALRELRYATKVFAPFEGVRKVSVFGSARIRPGDPSYAMAVEFTRMVAEAGWMVITGAGPGIMQAGNEGAGRDRSFGVNIRLPFEQSANPAIVGSPRLVTFRYFFVRKLFFVKESHAIVLFPGGFGTLDEGFEVLTLIQTGKTAPVPVVLLDRPGGDYWHRFAGFVDGVLRSRGLVSAEDTSLYTITDSVDRAVHEVLHFYRNYHSSRHLKGRMLIRLYRRPDEAQLAALATDFAGLLTPGAGGFEVHRGRARGEEEPGPFHPPWRLLFPFDRRSCGLLRRLVDRVNQW
jgi:uncharacterized protein (TIGR00730 family)